MLHPKANVTELHPFEDKKIILKAVFNAVFYNFIQGLFTGSFFLQSKPFAQQNVSTILHNP